MKFNRWTLTLAAAGIVTLPSILLADDAPKPVPLVTALSSTTLTGYVDTSAQLDFGAQTPGLPPYTVGSFVGNGKINSINLNVVDIALDKPQDEGQWAAGYHVELWFGPDATALGTSLDGAGNSSPAAIRQAYITLRTPIGNGLDWKIGVFDTIIGYESFSSGNNPNYSHSWGFAIEPTQHTGVLGTYRICEAATVSAGVANTSYLTAYTGAIGASGSNLQNPSWMADVSLTAPDAWGWIKGGTLFLGVVDTPSGGTSTFGVAGAGGATSYYAGLTMPTPLSTIKVGAAFDYLDEHTKSATGFFTDAHKDSLWSLAGYTTFQATDKLSLNLRGEYYSNKNAATFPFGVSSFSLINFAEAEEVTFTAQYSLWANVITRGEARWDHATHHSFATKGGTPEENAFMFAMQVIYQF